MALPPLTFAAASFLANAAAAWREIFVAGRHDSKFTPAYQFELDVGAYAAVWAPVATFLFVLAYFNAPRGLGRPTSAWHAAEVGALAGLGAAVASGVLSGASPAVGPVLGFLAAPPAAALLALALLRRRARAVERAI